MRIASKSCRLPLTVMALLACSMAVAGPHTHHADMKIEQLAWMAGAWEHRDGANVLEEHWMAPSGGCMMGIMRQSNNGKVNIREFEVIEETPEGLSFTLSHVGPKMAEMPDRTRLNSKATALKDGEVTFTATGTGAVRSLTYRKQPDGSLLAIVELERNGQKRTLELPLKRLKSTGS